MEQDEIEKIKQAGKVYQELVKFARDFIKKDMKLIEIANAIDNKIAELKSKPAFPVNLSINEQAAHCTPTWDSEEKAHGLLKVDIGVHIDGYVADGAFSLDLEEGAQSELNKKLIEAAESGLKAAVDKVGVDVSLGEVGKVVQESINEHGFVPIKNLTGHQIEQYDLHAGANVPSYDSKQDTKFGEGLFAIEPFATNGLGRVRDGRPSGIYRLDREGNVRDSFAREVLGFIVEEYQRLPFCSRWIYNKFGSRGLLALRQIEQARVIHHYPQLIEEGKGKIAQAEHTVLLMKDGKKIVITRD